MAHLIETIRFTEILEAVASLERTHKLIVGCAITAQQSLDMDPMNWGAQVKRLEIHIPNGEELIGKATEKFIEAVNILATTERTISALRWLSNKHPLSIVRECHPSTSDDVGGNDIVIIDESETIISRCEVTDVIASKAGQNGKEKKELKSLGCEKTVPHDLVSRYIVTSPEYAAALSSKNRKWNKLHYQYIVHPTNDKNDTQLLEIVPSILHQSVI